MRIAYAALVGAIALAGPAQAGPADGSPAEKAVSDPAVVIDARAPLRGAFAASDNWRDLGQGDALRPGDTLKTGASGRAVLLFPDGARVVVAKDSVLRVLPGGARLLAGRARFETPAAGRGFLLVGDWHVSGPDALAVAGRGSGEETGVAILAGRMRLSAEGTSALRFLPAGHEIAQGRDPRPFGRDRFLDMLSDFE